MIRIFAAGHLGSNAELKVTQGGDSVCSFSVACRVGKKDDPPQWIRASLWAKRGEALAPYLTKGTPVAVTGGLTVRTYEKDGETRVSLELRVDEITLMGGQRDEERDERPRGGSQQRGGRSFREPPQGRGAPPPRREQRREEPPPDDGDDFGYPGGSDDEIPF
jgi:single-strand DNA-binding protein